MNSPGGGAVCGPVGFLSEGLARADHTAAAAACHAARQHPAIVASGTPRVGLSPSDLTGGPACRTIPPTSRRNRNRNRRGRRRSVPIGSTTRTAIRRAPPCRRGPAASRAATVRKDVESHRQEAVMGNAVIHFELMSKEPAKVADFYQKVFDWKNTHHPEMNYRIVETGGQGAMAGINGGIVKPEKDGPWPGNMTFYILVDDLAAFRRKIVAAGGTLPV